MTNNKISNLIKAIAIMVVSASSHADTAYFGLRLGVQYVPEFCDIIPGWSSCHDNVAMANPYLRFNIAGPHNIEIGARATVSDYQMSFRGGGILNMNTSSWTMSYEVRPFGGQEPGPLAVRLGWHYTTYNIQAIAAHAAAFDSTEDNGFIVGLGFDPFRHINLSFDYADWGGDDAMSLMLGFEI